MILNIESILNYDGRKIPIEAELDISEDKRDAFKIVSPVKIAGEIVNFGGELELTLSAETELRLACDRCAEEYERGFEFQIFERFRHRDQDEAENDNENPEVTYFSGDSIDLSDIVYSNLILNMPAKNLCKDDCKGLCPICGVNLNDKTCDCSDEVTDPRFDILDSLDL
ncbi:MAG TPA: DUF177 domain-containing protein [Firmicutes bacterium]|nr:DUF177 domain-containing protein [Bacillota bacterium]